MQGRKQKAISNKEILKVSQVGVDSGGGTVGEQNLDPKFGKT